MQFINEDFKDLFNAILANQATSLATIAAAHHKPNPKEILQLIVQEADRLASGGERVANEGQKEVEGTGSWEDFKTVRLCPILETVGNYDKNGKVAFEYSLPISSIVLAGNTKDIITKYFPKKYESSQQDKVIANETKANYKQLWAEFTKELSKIKDFTDFKAFAETLMSLLHKYAVTVPSSTTDLPDVSLYDHLKVVSAMAVCLYDYLESKSRLTTPLEIKNEEKPFLLIGADISGIQSFIYDIISSKAAKNLKGRSFYLQLLTDSIVEKVTKDLQLFSANVIYASGGNFFVLAPNTDFVKKALGKLEKEITDKLFAEHKTNLGFMIDCVEVSKESILKKNIGQVWQSLYDKLDIKKKQKNKLQLLNNYAKFFEPFEQGGLAERDAITGEEFAVGETKYDYDTDENNRPISFVKKVNNEQVILGAKLREFDYAVLAQGGKESFFDKETFSPANLSNYFYFLEQGKFKEKSEKFKDYKKSSLHIARFNNLNFLENLISGNHSYGFAFYGGNDYPEIWATDKHKATKRCVPMPKTFSEMAGQKDADREYNLDTEKEFESVKFKRLAILRMDVDNLGSLFSQGFITDKATQTSVATFSRLASLSRNLDYFFKGFLNVIWNSKDEYKNYTQIIYSGGDDLFIVGHWNYIIDFAEDIQTTFKQWTCGNPQIGISGGITIVTPKFPISKAAALCEIDEKLAKGHKIEYEDSNKQKKIKEKNAITLFGEPLHWEHEFPIVKSLKEKLVKMDMPKSVLMKIQAFYYQAQEEQKKNKTQTWRWQMAYNFARAAQQYKHNEELKTLLHQIKIDVVADTIDGEKVTKKHDYFTLLNLAARWAEFELRGKKS